MCVKWEVNGISRGHRLKRFLVWRVLLDLIQTPNCAPIWTNLTTGPGRDRWGRAPVVLPRSYTNAWLSSPHPLPPLCRNDDVELIGGVDGSRESTARGAVAVTDIGDDSVEDDVSILTDRSDIFRQSDEEGDLLRNRR